MDGRKSSNASNSSRDLFDWLEDEERREEGLEEDGFEKERESNSLDDEDFVEENHRNLKRLSSASPSADSLPTRKRLRLTNDEPQVRQLVGMSSQLSLVSPSTSDANSPWRFSPTIQDDDNSIWRTCNSESSNSDESAINRSTTVSESEADGCGRRVGLNRRCRQQSKPVVYSDSEPESPNLRIRKSPRCQIFPKWPKTSTKTKKALSTTSLIDGPSTSRGVRNGFSSTGLVDVVGESVIQLSDDEIDGSPNPVQMIKQIEDDEEFAKILQAQFDSEANHLPLPPPPSPPPSSNLTRDRPTTTTTARRLRSRSSTRVVPRPLPDQFTPPYTHHHHHHHHDPFDVMDRSLRDLSGIWTTMQMTARQHVMWNDHNHGRTFMPDGFMSIGRTTGRTRGLSFTHLPVPAVGNTYEQLIGLADNIGEVNKGLNTEEIGQLPTRKVNEVPRASGPAGKETECQICMCDYAIGDEIRSLTCFHEFHKKCIDRWLKLNATCPICRVELDFNQG